MPLILTPSLILLGTVRRGKRAKEMKKGSKVLLEGMLCLGSDMLSGTVVAAMMW